MNNCARCIFLRNKPSIQIMASICLTFNSLFLLVHLFALLSSEDAAVEMKLNSIDTTPREIQVATIPRMVLLSVTVFVDAFLVIGIEDNYKASLWSFILWNTFMVAADALTVSGIAIWKGNKENLTLLLLCAGVYACVLIIKGFFAKQVYDYTSSLGAPETVPASSPKPPAIKRSSSRLDLDDDGTQMTCLDELGQRGSRCEKS